MKNNMRNNMKKRALILLFILVLGIITAACSGNSENNNSDEDTNINADEIRQFADPIAQNILEAMNEKNYEKFSKDFAQIMKESLDSKAFDLLTRDFDKRIGTFQSLSFSSIEKQHQFTIVVYNAKYSNEPNGVIVRVVFEKVENEYLVSGLYFDSPNIRK